MASKRKAVQFMWLKTPLAAGLRSDASAQLIEQLRYAGTISIVHETDEHYVLKLYEPHDVEAGGAWAEQNAARMQSFGINATVVKER